MRQPTQGSLASHPEDKSVLGQSHPWAHQDQQQQKAHESSDHTGFVFRQDRDDQLKDHGRQ